MMRILDTALAFPFLVLVIVIVAVIGPGLPGVYLAVFLLALDAVRAACPRRDAGRAQEGLHARRGDTGLSHVTHHLSPRPAQYHHLFDRLLHADYVLNILLLASLSFLGLGVQPPDPEWGSMIAEARDYIFDAWWICTLPGLVIVLAGTGLSLIGDGLANRLGQRH